MELLASWTKQNPSGLVVAFCPHRVEQGHAKQLL